MLSFLLTGGLLPAAHAQVATTTAISVATPSAAVGVPTLLTARVTDGSSHPVLLGTVTFYDGSRSLGSAQIVSGTTGAYPQGTANLKTASFSLGTNSITAVFAGTKNDGASTSPAKAVTVTGKNSTATTLNGYVTGTDFWLPATLVAYGSGVPTGSIDFVHVFDNALIGSKSLSEATWEPGFAISSTPAVFNEGGEGIVTGDFDNDGFLDLVNGALSVALGKGDGTFKPTVQDKTGRSAAFIYAGDFDNDGRLDLAIGSFQDGQIGIMLGNGDGTFQPPTLYGSLHNFSDATVADLNGDGNLDIVTTSEPGGHNPSAVVFLGNGDGTFQPQVLYPVSQGAPSAVRAGDMNGDGIPDLVVSSIGTGAVNVLLGKGDGTFLPYKQYGVSGYVSEGPSLTLGDVNGDGKLDVVTDVGPTVIVSLGIGDGSLGPVQSYQVTGFSGQFGPPFAAQPVLVDINQDGKLDIAVGVPACSTCAAYGAISVLFGNGNGTFQSPVGYLPSFTGTGYLLSGDFNGDGRPDLVTPSSSSLEEIVALSGQSTNLTLAKEELGPGTTTVQATYAGDGALTGSVSNEVKLSPNGTPPPGYGAGFVNTSNLALNGMAVPLPESESILLTTGWESRAGSFFQAAPQNIESFTTDFSFSVNGSAYTGGLNNADGFTFTIQNDGPRALGGIGGGLGYKGIPKSVAVKFDLYDNSGEGDDSTGIYTDGASPDVPAVDMTASGLNLHAFHQPVDAIIPDVFDVHMTYDGANLTMKIVDTYTNKKFSYSWPIDIPTAVGGTIAYVGFTGANGGEVANDQIYTWTFVPGMP